MAIAISLQDYLERNNVPYEVIPHRRETTMRAAAHSAGLPEDCVVKAVLLEDEDGYVLAAVPASCHVQLGEISKMTRRRVGLATEREIAQLFSDCEVGAVPPVGAAYGVETLVDESLDEQHDLYFEAGDHCSLVHVKGEDFARMLRDARYGHIGAED